MAMNKMVDNGNKINVLPLNYLLVVTPFSLTNIYKYIFLKEM